MDKKYTLSYLPHFEHDLAATRDYISFTLLNPEAALRLIEDVRRFVYGKRNLPEIL